MSDNDLPDDDEGIDVGPENNHELCVNEKNLKKSMEKVCNEFLFVTGSVHVLHYGISSILCQVLFSCLSHLHIMSTKCSFPFSPTYIIGC